MDGILCTIRKASVAAKPAITETTENTKNIFVVGRV